MMTFIKKTTLTLFSMAILIFSTSAVNATPILGNDAVFGLNSVINDSTINRSFLRLDFTTPYSFERVASELAAGGIFDGWAIASISDLALLGNSLGIIQGSVNPEQIVKVEALRNMFCFVCSSLSSTHNYARGLVSDIFDLTNIGIVQQAFSIGTRIIDPEEVDFRASGWGGATVITEEIFLVKNLSSNAVSESSSIVLLLFGVIGLIRLRKN